jgi:hypothetical protein
LAKIIVDPWEEVEVEERVLAVEWVGVLVVQADVAVGCRAVQGNVAGLF